MTPPDTQEQTGLGNYFVANYPPFSAWKPAHVAAAHAALQMSPRAGTPLGLYLHIPFCRKRCKFCYFRVYTDKNARDVKVYLNALAKEVELYSKMPIVGGRPLHYFYFGGGTPSYLSVAQLRTLTDRLRNFLPWDKAAEVTFECEPGTLQQHKLEALKEIGVTRLSLGVENFDDKVLEANGRAHLSQEIYRSYEWIKGLHFDQINIDLIAGMVGETWDNWRECVRKTIELAPDSVTIYQMELPFNTVFSKELQTVGHDEPPAMSIADWPTKRDWVQYAFDELGRAGYQTSSAYTAVKDKARCRFVYRDSLWHGADMFGTGVASFGHVGGVHVQNVDTWEQYLALLDKGELPLGRALPVTPRQLLIREMILQLKTGSIDARYFRQKFGADVVADFAAEFKQLAADGNATVENGTIRMTRPGMLQVDRLLPTFFEPEYRAHALHITQASRERKRPENSRIAMADDLTFMMGKFAAALPGDRRYARNHMWCQEHGELWRFGFTAYAVRLMKDVYFLDWTVDAGAKLALKQHIGHIETSKAQSDLFAPIAGQVVEFNKELLRDPSGINVDNYGPGWLFEMSGNADGTMTVSEYHQFLDAGWETTQRILKGHV